jgi:glycerol-3-phosphate acyltransferase PlsY
MASHWWLHWPAIVVLFTGAYLAGSISSAVVVCKLMGYPDPRDVGSHNPGATNVLRVAGKPAAALTLAGDVLKGVIPVLVARLVGLSPLVVAVTGLLAVVGHIFPVFFQFRGGKGIATAFGFIFVLNWLAGTITGLIWLAIFGVMRISSLASLLAFIAMPALIYWRQPALVWPMLALTLIILLRHHENIQRLWKGEEGNFKKSKAG